MAIFHSSGWSIPMRNSNERRFIPAPSRRRTSCKLKASSMPGATFCKIFATLALSTFLKLALRKQRVGLIIDAARVTWLPSRKSSRVNFLKRSSCRSSSVLKPVREQKERLKNGGYVHIISEMRYPNIRSRPHSRRERILGNGIGWRLLGWLSHGSVISIIMG